MPQKFLDLLEELLMADDLDKFFGADPKKKEMGAPTPTSVLTRVLVQMHAAIQTHLAEHMSPGGALDEVRVRACACACGHVGL